MDISERVLVWAVLLAAAVTFISVLTGAVLSRVQVALLCVSVICAQVVLLVWR